LRRRSVATPKSHAKAVQLLMTRRWAERYFFFAARRAAQYFFIRSLTAFRAAGDMPRRFRV
jgi:hypothetical protein